MCATSIQNARKLVEGIKESAQRQALNNGILIGGLKKRPVVLSEQQRQQLSEIYPGVSFHLSGIHSEASLHLIMEMMENSTA